MARSAHLSELAEKHKVLDRRINEELARPAADPAAISKLKIGVVTRAMMPFFVALFIVLLMVTYIPWLSLWLPRAMGL